MAYLTWFRSRLARLSFFHHPFSPSGMYIRESENLSFVEIRLQESASPVEPSDAENESDDEAVNDGDGSSSSADAGVTDNEASFGAYSQICTHRLLSQDWLDSHMLPQSENNAPKNDKTSSNDTVKLQRQLKGLLNRYYCSCCMSFALIMDLTV